MGVVASMVPNKFRFDRFRLDARDRRLTRDDVPVELNARYFDALALLVREPGALVSKDRFLTEVWRGVPVTDEALTQCIKTLRRALGDRAGDPRFIETVPKHGYRFIAPVVSAGDDRREQASGDKTARPDMRSILLLGGAGTIGGGLAGLVGGIFYGFGGATEPLAPAMGAASVLLVLVCLSILAGLIGGAGVGFGIAAAELAPSRRWPWSALGGALGGMVVGALAKLLGLDAFTLLLGQSPGAITGGGEGALLGGAVGLAAWLARADRLGRNLAIGALLGGLAGRRDHRARRAADGRQPRPPRQQPARLAPAPRPDRLMVRREGFGPVTQSRHRRHRRPAVRRLRRRRDAPSPVSHRLDRPEQDQQVEPGREIFDVEEVVLQLLMDLVDVGDMALVDLRPAAKSPAARRGDSGRRGFRRCTSSTAPALRAAGRSSSSRPSGC
jgi:DNA-binding winged helix-turn-helix (wHTH) protein